MHKHTNSNHTYMHTLYTPGPCLFDDCCLCCFTLHWQVSFRSFYITKGSHLKTSETKAGTSWLFSLPYTQLTVPVGSQNSLWESPWVTFRLAFQAAPGLAGEGSPGDGFPCEVLKTTYKEKITQSQNFRKVCQITHEDSQSLLFGINCAFSSVSLTWPVFHWNSF